MLVIFIFHLNLNIYLGTLIFLISVDNNTSILCENEYNAIFYNGYHT